MANPNDKRTASQRIDDLERAVMSIFNVTNNMARDNTLIKNALKLLDSKVECMMEASVAGDALTDENITIRMKAKELEELKGKVANLVTQGFLVPAEEIAEGAFVVGAETEPDAADGTAGKVIHARLQFTLASLDKEIQAKLIGAKAGSVVSFKDDALVFKVAEVYKIVNPTPPAPAVAPAPEAAAPAADASVTPAPAASPDAAPAASQSSSDASTAAPAATDTTQAAGN